MNTTYKNEIKLALQIGILLFVSYFVSIVIFLVLPKEKPTAKIIINSGLEYKSFDFQNAFGVREVIPAPVVTVVRKIKATPPPPPPPVVVEPIVEVAPPPPPPPPPPLVLSINVVAIFDMGKGRGFVTINERGNRGTTILSTGETYKSIKLLKVFPKYALFLEGDTEYKIELNSVATVDRQVGGGVSTPSQPPQTLQQKPVAPISTTSTERIQQIGNKTVVNKDLLNEYTKNSDKIWRDISLKENLNNGKIDGFMVNKVKRGSNFEKLGIKSGDILKSVNNVELKSYDDAMNIYKKVGSMSYLNMKIIRGNETMELGYEIK